MAKKIPQPAKQSVATKPRKFQPPQVQATPTVTELAQLAATLATRQSIMTIEKSADLAYDLWNACKAKLEAETVKATGDNPTAQEPPTIPVTTLDEFLKAHCLAERTMHDRKEKFREYLIQTFDPKKWRENWDKELPFVPKETPSKEEFADGIIADLENRVAVRQKEFDQHVQPFKDWQLKDRAEKYSARGQKGARVRHTRQTHESY